MHTETRTASPEEGKTYRFHLHDVPLYDAVVERSEGCWATVRVVRPLPGKYEAQYRTGQQFDIKHAFYNFEDVGST